MKENAKAIIFDYDGVMADTEKFNTQKCLEAARICGIELSLAQYKEYAYPGASLSQIADSLSNHFNRPEFTKKFIEVKKSFDKDYETEILEYPDLSNLIKKLSDKYQFSICSGSRRSLIDIFLSKYGLREYFKFITTSESVIKGKPDPEGYQKTVNQLNLNKNQIIVIEDGISGIIAAKKCGLYVIGITSSVDASELINAGADEIINNLSELMAPSVA